MEKGYSLVEMSLSLGDSLILQHGLRFVATTRYDVEKSGWYFALFHS